MQVDGFTVVAQVVNFLILVFLLKRFLYAPVIEAMDRREQRVTDRLKSAEEREHIATESAEAYRHRTEEIDRRRKELREKARQEADALRAKLLDNARTEIDAQREEWHATFERELDAFLFDLRGEATRGVVRATRRALESLAGEALEDRMVEVFLARLGSLDTEARTHLAEALAAPGARPTVASAFELAETRREQIRAELDALCGVSADIEFDGSADLVCGIELRMRDWVMGWSVDAFVDDLDEAIAERLRAHRGVRT